MSAPEWMNWGGWHWIAIAIAYASGTWFGWSIRSTKARSDEVERWIREQRDLRDMDRKP